MKYFKTPEEIRMENVEKVTEKSKKGLRMTDSKGNEIKVGDVLKNPDDRNNDGIYFKVDRGRVVEFGYIGRRGRWFRMDQSEMNKSKWVKVER